MSEDLYFTKEELLRLKKKNLFRLAEFYGIEIRMSWKKQRMVDAIYDHFPHDLDEAQYPEMSVRVRRIYERKLKGESP